MKPCKAKTITSWILQLIAAVILLYEHSLVHPGNLAKLDAAFFMMNGMLSITLLFFVLAERIRPLLSRALSGVWGGRFCQ